MVTHQLALLSAASTATFWVERCVSSTGQCPAWYPRNSSWAYRVIMTGRPRSRRPRFADGCGSWHNRSLEVSGKTAKWTGAICFPLDNVDSSCRQFGCRFVQRRGWKQARYEVNACYYEQLFIAALTLKVWQCKSKGKTRYCDMRNEPWIKPYRETHR